MRVQRHPGRVWPPGLNGGKNILYHNNGDGTFTDVSERAGIWNTTGTYALSLQVADLDNDGWPDIMLRMIQPLPRFTKIRKMEPFKM